MANLNIKSPEWLRHMQSILEELNEGVVIVDDQLRIVFANEALIRMGQYDREEIEGRTPDALFPAADVPYIMREHESGHRYGHSRTEFYLPRKNGERIPAIFSGRSIQGPDGQEYVLLILTDISEQKSVEEQLRESNAQLGKRQLEMESELSLAARVQHSLAPQNLVWNDVSVETYYNAARTIGGDFGVVFPHGEDVLTVLLCDVSGHGIGSALMANRIYSETLHQLERKVAPDTLLRNVHDFVRERIATDGFYFTMAAVRFSQRGRRMAFAGAGHPPALLASKGHVRLLDSQNGILGSLSELVCSNSVEEISLEPGDRLVLYTDGLAEVFNEHNVMLDVDGLARLVLDAATLPLPEMRQAVLDGVTNWCHGPLADDVSLVIVEVC